MNVNFQQNQLNSLLGQLNIGNNKNDSLEKTMARIARQAQELKEQKNNLKTAGDSVEISDASKKLSASQSTSQSVLSQTSGEYTNDSELNTDGKQGIQNIQAGGLNISFQFDLFYELSSQVEAQMGKSGAERFVSLGAKVAETFQTNFSLSIDAVGSFMNGTEQSLAISNETANAFFDAVGGMADLSPESLENFLKESDKFFDELKSVYGNAEGAFDQIKETMQSQAKDFFNKVTEMQENAISESKQPALEDKNIAEAQQSEEQENPNIVEALDLKPTSKNDILSSLLDGLNNKDNDSQNNLISMFYNKDVKLSKDDYSGFLSDFQNFADRLKANMFNNMFNMKSETNNIMSGLNLKA